MTPSIKATPKTEEATLKQQMKYALMNPKHILKLYEAETGARYCVHCRDMLPLGNFLRPQKYALCHFSCKLHRKVSPGRPIKYRDPDAQLRRKAALSIVSRARDDKAVFRHAIVDLSLDETQALLTQEQVDDFTDFAIVPARPTEILSKRNVVVVSFSQRRYLTAMWKANHDAEAYERDMAALLSGGSPQPVAVI